MRSHGPTDLGFIGVLGLGGGAVRVKGLGKRPEFETV